MTPALVRALEAANRGRRNTQSLMKPDAPPPPDLTAALHDAVAMLRELHIDYALIGGVAAMVHGRSRYTEDVDFVAQPLHADILAAHPQVMARHRFDPDCTWKLYHQSGIEIDLWKDEHAQDIVDRAVRRKLGGRFIKVAEAHDLIAMKLRADRPQDDYDISEIVQKQNIDQSKVRKYVDREQYARFIKIVKRVK